jgi:methionine synthase II (cobalamin-independent)
VSVDLDVLPAEAYDEVAGLLEAGRPVHLGVVPGTAPARPPSDRAVTDRVLGFLDTIGLDPDAAASLVLTPSCGLAGADQAWARTALALCRTVAANLRD